MKIVSFFAGAGRLDLGFPYFFDIKRFYKQNSQRFQLWTR